MAVEFKVALSKLEEERVSKNIKEISELMDRSSIIMKSEIELLKGKDIKKPDINKTILLVASYINVQETLKDFMNALLPVVK